MNSKKYSKKMDAFDEYLMTQSLNKTRENKNDDYYCGGQSSLALRGLQMDNTPVSINFFSKKNISKIQKEIKHSVYKKSNGKYILEEDQDELDLLLFMRAIFVEHAKNLPCDIDGQIKELNRITLREILPGMFTNIEQQIGYLRDISQPIQPIDLPINVNNAGRRNLPSVTDLWN